MEIISKIPNTIEYSFEWVGEHGRGVNKSIYITMFINTKQETHKITYQVYSHKTLILNTQNILDAIEEYNRS